MVARRNTLSNSRSRRQAITLSLLIEFVVTLRLGLPMMEVVIFENLLYVASSFNHANVRIATGINRLLRWLFVAPGTDRAHQPLEDDESNWRLDFDLAWHDRPFGTCRPIRPA